MKKFLLTALAIITSFTVLAGCSDEIKPDKKTEDLMNEQRAAMSGDRTQAPPTGPDGAPATPPGK